MAKLSKKEKFDIKTVMYFSLNKKIRVTQADKLKYANLSSRGIKPKRETKGYKRLLNGKMWRDYQITAWMNDVKAGYFTKYEIINSVPTWLQETIESKLQHVPYDVNNETTQMFTATYQGKTSKIFGKANYADKYQRSGSNG